MTFEASIRATRPGGRVSVIGYHGENPDVMTRIVVTVTPLRGGDQTRVFEASPI